MLNDSARMLYEASNLYPRRLASKLAFFESYLKKAKNQWEIYAENTVFSAFTKHQILPIGFLRKSAENSQKIVPKPAKKLAISVEKKKKANSTFYTSEKMKYTV